MDERPPDFIPPTPPTTTGAANLPATRPTTPPSRRGGRRPGAGAKPDNLNALKHGRHSRFKGALPITPLDPAAIANRVLAQEQRTIQRIAASFLRVLIEARYKRDIAEATAAGRPLPPPTLITGTDQDLRRVVRYMASLTGRAELARAHPDGPFRPQSQPLPNARGFLHNMEKVLPAIVASLDRATRATLPHDALAALLTPRNDQQNDQPAQIPPLPSLKGGKEIKGRRNHQSDPSAPTTAGGPSRAPTASRPPLQRAAGEPAAHDAPPSQP